jgi:hypothetical protein
MLAMAGDSPSAIERAYELAKSGRFRTLTEIRARLRSEGYDDAPAHFTSLTLTADLRRTIAAARLND